MTETTLEVNKSSSSPPFRRDILTAVCVQDRLREHAEAFDGLLSLIPAKHYYGGDNSVGSRRHTWYAALINSSAGPVEEEEANERAGSRGKESKTRPRFCEERQRCYG